MPTRLFQIANWYRISEIEPDVFWINEPGHVNFYVFKSGSHGLFLDSGLGLQETAMDQLLKALGLETFDVACTHAHCDHIGMNYRARKIYISEIEWKKYLAQNEAEQIAHYYEALKDEAPWPDGLQAPKRTRDWQPTDFVAEKDVISFDRWKFRVLSGAGHTSGSLIFLEETMKAAFTGDLIYTGRMYLHLKDSDYQQFKISLQKIIDLQAQSVTIWPSHNRIPLPASFPLEVQQFIEQYEKGLITNRKPYSKDRIFEDGVALRHKTIKITLKEEP